MTCFHLFVPMSGSSSQVRFDLVSPRQSSGALLRKWIHASLSGSHEKRCANGWVASCHLTSKSLSHMDPWLKNMFFTTSYTNGSVPTMLMLVGEIKTDIT